MEFLKIFLLTLGLFLNFSQAQFTPSELIANVSELGLIQGISATTRNGGRPFINFRGIPYGSSARFGASNLLQDRLAPEGSTFNATEFGPQCPQPNLSGSEDCLVLNIATHDVTNLTTSNLRPVIVFIHGAAFVSGNADRYSGDLLLKRDLVVVSFNYRLGAFGYFCLNTEIAPCNGALYDAITVLKWVQRYIQYFGGDPNQVTLIGQSSGSTSVAHILNSPLARGLFKGAMALSGNAISEWAYARDPLNAALDVASRAGCASESLTIIGQCMENRSQENVTRAMNDYQEFERASGRLGFAAVNPASQVSQGLGSTQVLLPCTPCARHEITVPLITGSTLHDGQFGLVMLLGTFLQNEDLQNDANFLKNYLIPILLNALSIKDDTGAITETISWTYMKESGRSGNFTQMLPGLLDMASVLFFKAAAHRTALTHSDIAPTYLYSFDFAGSQTNHRDPNIPLEDVVAHADDLFYVFGTFNGEFDERESKMSDLMVDFWANFASTGNPNSPGVGLEWPQITRQDQKFLAINDVTEVGNDYPARWSSLDKDEEKDGGNSATLNTSANFMIFVGLIFLGLFWQ